MNKMQICVLLFVAALIVTGCSSGDGRQAASGTVTLDGQPLASGSINFRPAPGTKGNSSGGTIRNGEFKIAADKGLPAGKYTVTVQTYKKTGRMVQDPQMGETPQMAAVKFQEVAILEAEITADSENRFEFKLTSVH